ncbi:MAG TPA: phosphate-binding protein, partial [Alphaproteobacteria bacterium]
MIRKLAYAAAFSALALPAAAQGVSLDPSLPLYKPVSGVSGNLKSIGSDTLNNLMTLWAEGFKSKYP